MDFRSLNTFIQVAELGSFSRAGEKLGYSQPTVSVHIRQLEEYLGVKLFDRIGHAVQLTDRGREILSHAQKICHLCEHMSQAAGQQNTVSGVIRMATAESLCAPLIHRIYPKLRALYPDIRLELLTAGTAELFRLLDHNEVDIVCTLDSHIYNTNYVIAGEEKLGVHFVAAASDPLAKVGRITKADLLEQKLLLTEKGMSYRRLLDEWMARDSMQLQPILENGSADLLCSLVEAGAGVSFLPDYVTEAAVHRGSVVLLQAEGFTPELWMQFLYRRDKWVSLPMKAMLEQMTDVRLGTDAEKTGKN